MLCTICERGCRLAPGHTGACGLYEEEHGEVKERFPDRYLVACPISIETMPVLHFFPGGKFLQVSTAGCNFDCPGCISTVIVREMDSRSTALRHLPPERVVELAEKNECLGIVFLMNDPLASLPTFLRLATLAKSRGLRIGCATNGYFTEASLALVIPGARLHQHRNQGVIRPSLPCLRRFKRRPRATQHTHPARPRGACRGGLHPAPGQPGRTARTRTHRRRPVSEDTPAGHAFHPAGRRGHLPGTYDPAKRRHFASP